MGACGLQLAKAEKPKEKSGPAAGAVEKLYRTFASTGRREGTAAATASDAQTN